MGVIKRKKYLYHTTKKEEVTQMNKTCADCIYEDVCKIRHFPSMFGLTGADCGHFKDKSRYIELKCDKKSTVYVLTSDSPTGIEKSVCNRIIITRVQDVGNTPKYFVPCVYDDWGGAHRTFYNWDFGKTIFLTREDAEKALKGGVE